MSRETLRAVLTYYGFLKQKWNVQGREKSNTKLLFCRILQQNSSHRQTESGRDCRKSSLETSFLKHSTILRNYGDCFIEAVTTMSVEKSAEILRITIWLKILKKEKRKNHTLLSPGLFWWIITSSLQMTRLEWDMCLLITANKWLIH